MSSWRKNKGQFLIEFNNISDLEYFNPQFYHEHSGLREREETVGKHAPAITAGCHLATPSHLIFLV